MLSSLIAGLVTGETLAALQRARRAAIAYGLAAVFGALGSIFLLIAATIWAARRYGAVEACLAFGGGFIVLALLTMAFHKLGSEVRVKVARKRRNRDMAKVAAAAGLAVLPTILRGRAGPFVLLAPAIAALVYGVYRENSARDDNLPDE